MSSERDKWIMINADRSTKPVRVRRRRAKVTPETASVETEDSINQMYQEAWEAHTLTPDLVIQRWAKFWEEKVQAARLRGVEIDLQVPLCDRRTQDLAALSRRYRGVVFIPDELMTPAGLQTLLDLIPTASSSLRTTAITNFPEDIRGGWLDVEMNIAAPNPGLNAKSLRHLFRGEGREGQTVQTYLVASKFSEEQTGHYFDSAGTFSALPGSVARAVIYASDAIFTDPYWRAADSPVRSRKGMQSARNRGSVIYGGRSQGRIPA